MKKSAQEGQMHQTTRNMNSFNTSLKKKSLPGDLPPKAIASIKHVPSKALALATEQNLIHKSKLVQVK